MIRKQNVFTQDGLLSAIQSEIKDMNPHELSKFAGLFFGLKIFPRGSFSGQLFVTEDKVTNKHLENHLMYQVDFEPEILKIISEVKGTTTGDKIFPKVALRLIGSGYHLSFADIKRAVEYVQ
ncbi:hypothetical protein NTH44_003173 [Vibrio metoecus]